MYLIDHHRFELEVMVHKNIHTFITFLPEANFGLQVLSLPASVCVCVNVCVCQPRACLHHNIQAKITKFRPEMENTLVKITIGAAPTTS